MFEFKADDIVNSLWDSLRPSRHDYPGASITKRLDRETGEYQITQPGLVVTMDLRVFHHGLNGEEYHRAALVHTVLTANTSVFQASSADWDRWDQVALDSYYNYSNHDSCWRSDGMQGFDKLFFEMCAGMNEEMVAHRSNPLAPREYDQFCTLGSLGTKPWEFIDVSHRKIPGEYHRRELLGLERRK